MHWMPVYKASSYVIEYCSLFPLDNLDDYGCGSAARISVPADQTDDIVEYTLWGLKPKKRYRFWVTPISVRDNSTPIAGKRSRFFDQATEWEDGRGAPKILANVINGGARIHIPYMSGGDLEYLKGGVLTGRRQSVVPLPELGTLKSFLSTRPGDDTNLYTSDQKQITDLNKLAGFEFFPRGENNSLLIIESTKELVKFMVNLKLNGSIDSYTVSDTNVHRFRSGYRLKLGLPLSEGDSFCFQVQAQEVDSGEIQFFPKEPFCSIYISETGRVFGGLIGLDTRGDDIFVRGWVVSDYLPITGGVSNEGSHVEVSVLPFLDGIPGVSVSTSIVAELGKAPEFILEKYGAEYANSLYSFDFSIPAEESGLIQSGQASVRGIFIVQSDWDGDAPSVIVGPFNVKTPCPQGYENVKDFCVTPAGCLYPEWETTMVRSGETHENGNPFEIWKSCEPDCSATSGRIDEPGRCTLFID